MTASVCVPDLVRRAKGRDSWFMKRNLHSKRTRPSYHTLTRRNSTSGLVRHGQALEASYNMAHYGRSCGIAFDPVRVHSPQRSGSGLASTLELSRRLNTIDKSKAHLHYCLYCLRRYQFNKS